MIVTQYFWPENFRINDLCFELSQRGHDVTVLTGSPNYPDGIVFPEFKKDPKVYNHFSGCDVLRVPMVARGKGSSLKLLLNYFSYVAFASLVGCLKIKNKCFDVVFVYEPSPITVCLPAIFIKKLRKIPVALWVQDLWPETLSSVGIVKSRSLLFLIGKLVSFIYNRCDVVLGQSRAFYDGIARYCDNESKIKYFPNWAEDIFWEVSMTEVPELVNCKESLKILFAGNIGEAQDFPSILRAVEILKSRQVKAKLFVVGDGRMFDWVSNEISRSQLHDYVCLMGRHPLELMPSFYASADVLMVSLKKSPVFEVTIPSKIQSYMAAGKPIVTMLSGEGSRIVEEASCGLVSKSGDCEGLADNIIKMSAMTKSELSVYGDNARSYAKKEFDRVALIDQLENWFDEIFVNKGNHLTGC